MNKPLGKAHEARLTRHRAQGKIHAKAVQGRFNTARWIMVWLTQIVFYGLCWLNWDSADGRRQAVLFDIPGQKLYVFDLILWPQDALILAFVLIIAATALFLVTALAGRLFAALPVRRRSPASSPGSRHASKAITLPVASSMPVRRIRANCCARRSSTPSGLSSPDGPRSPSWAISPRSGNFYPRWLN